MKNFRTENLPEDLTAQFRFLPGSPGSMPADPLRAGFAPSQGKSERVPVDPLSTGPDTLCGFPEDTLQAGCITIVHDGSIREHLRFRRWDAPVFSMYNI